MTLAVILLCCVSLSSWASPGTQTETSPQLSPPTATKPSVPASAQATTTTTAKPKHRRHKKKAADPCAAAAPANSSAAPVTGENAQSASSAAATNCPPPKVIVRQGGTSEPSIQLAGKSSADDRAAQQNDTTQQLGTTGQNLKKIEGRQLTPDQQDMVNQIKQFMEQSKLATDAGDLERAHTLAGKAKLLSDELAKPQQ